VLRWIMIVSTALVIALGAAACGDDDDGDAGPTPPEGIDIGDELPDDWPGDFPIYPDAELDSVVSSTEEGIAGTVATFTTGDAFEDVTDFYTEELADGPWVAVGNPVIDAESALFFVETENGRYPESNVTITAGEQTDIFVFIVDEE